MEIDYIEPFHIEPFHGRSQQDFFIGLWFLQTEGFKSQVNITCSNLTRSPKGTPLLSHCAVKSPGCSEPPLKRRCKRVISRTNFIYRRTTFHPQEPHPCRMLDIMSALADLLPRLGGYIHSRSGIYGNRNT